MTYLKLLEADWNDIKDIITKEDKLKLKEISKAHIGMDINKDMREYVRSWCLSRDREEKLNKLL
jgi:hypothetical protein